jgi:DNA-binding transcriptional ArsR family regulator
MAEQNLDGRTDVLQEIFSSRLRAAVLSQMLPRPHLGYSLTDLSRLLGLPISSLQHECYKLERLGLIESRRAGNTRRYRVVTDSPYYAPLGRLVAAALGLEIALHAGLESVTGLEAAFLAGEPHATPDHPARLVLIGEIPLEELDAIQERAVIAVNGAPETMETVFYRQDDWRERVNQRSAFVLSLLDGPRIDLVGVPAGVS